MQIPVTQTIIFLVVLIIFIIICVKARKLSLPAALTAGLIGILIFAGAGYPGIVLLAVFFVLGTWATSHQKEKKVMLEADGPEPQQRKPGQVLANGGVAALMAVAALADPPHRHIYLLMLAASMASATADTLSSELGMVYGRRHFNILTWKKEARGLDGVISLEGTLLGALGALIIALLYAALISTAGAWYVLVAGIAGNFMDSVLGATLERKKFINNDIVNSCNTLFAALTALFIYWCCAPSLHF
ncbi:DUF92 domain-containing protein [Chitinophaga solisilvae]|uniref:DUF92 domain-containing protein n=1 Tax=Chitinophaga solisilvae TaxID=1233460 RepID=UPI00136FED03|nr:DUF92 domain-containing protein [Chitinophaga solisilvae]